jgi:hypothetical protein
MRQAVLRARRRDERFAKVCLGRGRRTTNAPIEGSLGQVVRSEHFQLRIRKDQACCGKILRIHLIVALKHLAHGRDRFVIGNTCACVLGYGPLTQHLGSGQHQKLRRLGEGRVAAVCRIQRARFLRQLICADIHHEIINGEPGVMGKAAPVGTCTVSLCG